MHNQWSDIHKHILELEQQGVITRTFRRLDPGRQQAVIDAILDEAIQVGPGSINIKRVAERAGVSVGSLYTYFNNRQGLLDFTTELSVRATSDALSAVGPYLAQMPLREALLTYLSSGVEWSAAMTGMMQFLGRAAYTGESALTETVVRPVADTMRRIIEDRFAQALENGEVRADIDFPAVARAVNTLLIAAGDSQILPYLNQYFQLTSEEITPERAFAAVVDLILHGIAPGDAQA